MSKKLQDIIIDAVEDLKGKSITILDVKGLTSVTDTLIIVSGTSNRHVKSLAQNVIVETKKRSSQPIGVEGEDVGEWILVDYGDIVVHVMLPATREFYDLERLWSVSVNRGDADSRDGCS